MQKNLKILLTEPSVWVIIIKDNFKCDDRVKGIAKQLSESRWLMRNGSAAKSELTLERSTEMSSFCGRVGRTALPRYRKWALIVPKRVGSFF